jgi:hypothetical protein
MFINFKKKDKLPLNNRYKQNFYKQHDNSDNKMGKNNNNPKSKYTLSETPFIKNVLGIDNYLLDTKKAIHTIIIESELENLYIELKKKPICLPDSYIAKIRANQEFINEVCFDKNRKPYDFKKQEELLNQIITK